MDFEQLTYVRCYLKQNTIIFLNKNNKILFRMSLPLPLDTSANLFFFGRIVVTQISEILIIKTNSIVWTLD